MRNKYSVLVIFILIIMIIVPNISKAEPVTLTKENFKKQFDKILELSSDNEEKVKFEITDDEIKMKNEEKSFTIKYDLTNEPQFTSSVEVKNGMTYDEYSDEVIGLIMPVFGYIAVAGANGVEPKDSSVYIFTSIFYNEFLSEIFEQEGYTVVDDEDEILQSEKTIKKSEFGNHVMEFVNAKYKDRQIYVDNEEGGIDSFSWNTEMKNVTENSCKLVSTLTIKKDADFTKLKDFAKNFENSEQIETAIDNNIGNLEKMAEKMGKDIIKKSNDTTNEITTTGKNNTNTNSNNTTAKGNNTNETLPKTGKTSNPILNGLYITVGLCTVALCVMIVNRKKLINK